MMSWTSENKILSLFFSTKQTRGATDKIISFYMKWNGACVRYTRFFWAMTFPIIKEIVVFCHLDTGGHYQILVIPGTREFRVFILNSNDLWQHTTIWDSNSLDASENQCLNSHHKKTIQNSKEKSLNPTLRYLRYDFSLHVTFQEIRSPKISNRILLHCVVS